LDQLELASSFVEGPSEVLFGPWACPDALHQDILDLYAVGVHWEVSAFAVVQELDQETGVAYHCPDLDLGKQSLVEVGGAAGEEGGHD
jgi:hypothetical protein